MKDYLKKTKNTESDICTTIMGILSLVNFSKTKQLDMEYIIIL